MVPPRRRVRLLPPEGALAPWGGPAALGSPRRQRGFTYLAVLFLVAMTAAALAALGQAWSHAAQRERERELQFRGEAIAAAITSYQKAGTTAAPELPRTLDDLIEDRRGVVPKHHLRQRYIDPFTGEADWELMSQTADKTRFSAVRSRSEHPMLRTLTPDGTPLRKAGDWVFKAPPVDGPPVKAPGAAASAPVAMPAVPPAASAPF